MGSKPATTPVTVILLLGQLIMAPKQSEKKSKDNINLAKEEPLRGKAARNDFLSDLATASSLPVGDVKKCLDGLRITLSRQLRENKKCRIPNIATLTLKIIPAREESKQTIFGKEKTIKARGEVKKIVIAPLKVLKDGVQ